MKNYVYKEFKDKFSRNLFPITKVVMKPKMKENVDPNVIRLRFLEPPWRWYRSLSYHWQAFIKTCVISFMLVVPPYNFVYMIMYSHSKADILSKQDESLNPDNLKHKIRDFNRRKKEGKIESFSEQEKNA